MRPVCGVPRGVTCAVVSGIDIDRYTCILKKTYLQADLFNLQWFLHGHRQFHQQ